MGVKNQGVPVKIPNLALQCAARFYIGSSSLCSRYRIPSAPPYSTAMKRCLPT